MRQKKNRAAPLPTRGMLSSGTNPARDDLVERPLAVNARDPHMRDIGAVRAGEAAVELGADCGREVARLRAEASP